MAIIVSSHTHPEPSSEAPEATQSPNALTNTKATRIQRGMSHGDSQSCRSFLLWHHLPAAKAQAPTLEAPCLLTHKAGGKDESLH